MPQRGKKYIDATRRFDRAKVHTPAEAVELIRSLPKRNFDETVEAAFRLGVDPRKADQMIRDATELVSVVPAWLQADHDGLTAKVLRRPERDEILVPVQEQLIVELYSK